MRMWRLRTCVQTCDHCGTEREIDMRVIETRHLEMDAHARVRQPDGDRSCVGP
jgi:hypothetical protein